MVASRTPQSPPVPTGAANERATEPTRPHAAWLGLVAALLTLAGYGIGSSRAFDYDGSVTVANFIRADSFAEVFTRQSTYNNHLGFSLIEHVVWRLTGSDSEWLLRGVPILAAAACVGLLVWWSALRYGAVTALLAGLLLAVNPVFLTTGREVRGYSLLTLCALASTMLLAKLEDRPTRAASVGYVAVSTLGLVVHLYMVPVIVLQVVWLWSRHRVDRSWRMRWIVMTLVAAACYLGMLPAMRAAQNTKQGIEWGAPARVAYELLGRQPLAVAVIVLGLSLFLRPLRNRREAQALTLASAGVLVAMWLVGPTELYTRFFVWSTPGIALMVALGLRRLAVGPVVAIAAAGAMLAVSLPGYTEDSVSNRTAGKLVDQARERGERACGLGAATETVDAYTRQHVPFLADADALTNCDLLVVINPTERPDVVRAARQHYAFERRLSGAHEDGIVFANRSV